MNDIDKGKLKVLIKMILIQESPRRLTANQISSMINQYDWGFRRNITSAIIGKLLGYELNKPNTHFLKNVMYDKKGGVYVYYIPSVNNK